MQNESLTVLVTGATGFIGKALCEYLLNLGYKVKAAGRKPKYHLTHPRLHYFVVDNIDNQTYWQPMIEGVDVVIHLAARVHQMREKGLKLLPLYQKVNVLGTQQLARFAIQHEVKRFIYLSSVKVLAEKTIESPLRAEDQPRPKDAYSVSKLQGEQILCQEAKRSAMEWVIIRPPLVYGKGVGGNFKKLFDLAQSRLPLPFSTIKNKRSFVGIQNLVSLIECCIAHPNAGGEVFLVSDNADLSTPQLIKKIRHQKGRLSWLFPFPMWFIKFIAFLLGRRQMMARLTESLQVNIEKTTRLLNWSPPISVEDCLKSCLIEELPVQPEIRSEKLPLTSNSI